MSTQRSSESVPVLHIQALCMPSACLIPYHRSGGPHREEIIDNVHKSICQCLQRPKHAATSGRKEVLQKIIFVLTRIGICGLRSRAVQLPANGGMRGKNLQP